MPQPEFIPDDVLQSIDSIAARFWPLHEAAAHELRIHYMMGFTDATNKCADELIYYTEKAEAMRREFPRRRRRLFGR